MTWKDNVGVVEELKVEMVECTPPSYVIGIRRSEVEEIVSRLKATLPFTNILEDAKFIIQLLERSL
jgi:hypothetical protein